METERDDRLDRIVALLRERVKACDDLIYECRASNNRMGNLVFARRDELNVILSCVLEIVGPDERKQVEVTR